MKIASSISPFIVRDCSLAAIATGIKVQTLTGLRDRLAIIHPGCIYYHFWGGRLRTSYEFREYHNDFSYWAHRALHDEVLAERLELLDPTEFKNLDDLRLEIIELIENRLDEREIIPWALEQFHFIRSKIIIFETRHIIQSPHDLVHILPKLSHSSIFYHFIDSVRRVPDGNNDISFWLSSFEEYPDLVRQIKDVDPYFISLSDLQEKVINIVTSYFIEE